MVKKYVLVKARNDNYIFVQVATLDAQGIVKPDGETIGVDNYGEIKVLKAPSAKYYEKSDGTQSDKTIEETFNTKLDKQSGSSTNTQVYGVKNGNQVMLNVSDGTTQPFSAIPQYNLSGELWVQRPTNSNNAANKGYVDDVAKNKLDKQNGSPAYPQVYGVEGGVQKLYKVSDGSNISPHDNIAKYSDRGTLYSQPPEQDGDVANKEYVDNSNQSVIQIIDGIELVKINNLQYQLNVNNKPSGTIDIPKDQFLKSVSYDPDTKILTFTFTTSTGDVTTTIDMSSLVDVYIAGNGLTLSSNTFSIKLDPNANNALSLSANGLLLDKTQFAGAQEFSGLNTDYQAFKTNQTTINSSVNNTLLQLASDIVTSETQTGAFINGQNTLKDVMASVEVQSKNLFNINSTVGGNDTANYSVEGNSISVTSKKGESGSFCYIECGDFDDGTTLTLSVGNIEQIGTTGAPALRLWWRVNNTFYNGEENGEITGYIVNASEILSCIVKKPKNAQSLCVLMYSAIGISNIDDGGKFTNIQLEVGSTKTNFSPYLPAGTPVNITACGKNLFNNNNQTPDSGTSSGANVKSKSDNQVIIENIYATSDLYNYVGFKLPNLYDGQKLTLKGEWEVSASNKGQLSIFWLENRSFITSLGVIKTSGETLSITVSNRPSQNSELYLLLYGTTAGNQTQVGDTVTYTNVQLEVGDTVTDFVPYKSQDYSSQVGQTVDVTQYDDVTNIFSTTDGGAVSTQFFLSTKYELNDKVNLLVGTLANRPTTTQAYGVIYIATDQTGANRVTYLPPNTDGIVSGNWISFNS